MCYECPTCHNFPDGLCHSYTAILSYTNTQHFLLVFPGDGFNGSTYISWDVELFCSAELKQSWHKGLRWRIVWRFDHIGSCQKAGSCRCRWCNRRVWAVLILIALYFIACKWAVWVWGLFEERWRQIKYNREHPASELVSVENYSLQNWSWVLCQVRNIRRKCCGQNRSFNVQSYHADRSRTQRHDTGLLKKIHSTVGCFFLHISG